MSVYYVCHSLYLHLPFKLTELSSDSKAASYIAMYMFVEVNLLDMNAVFRPQKR